MYYCVRMHGITEVDADDGTKKSLGHHHLIFDVDIMLFRD